MSAYSEVSQLKEIIGIMEDNLYLINSKSNIQKQLYSEYINIFEKFSKNLLNLTSKINEHVNKTESKKKSDSSNQIFKSLNTVLTKISNHAKGIAIKGKNQIVDPLKLFNDNYTNLNKSFLVTLKQKQLALSDKYAELYKNKQSYIAASERLQKSKKTQAKLMLKIEGGEIGQLDRFNKQIRKITQNIKYAEQLYMNSVRIVNKQLNQLRKDLKEITSSLAYNEQSRISFTKKTLLNSLKNLKEFLPESLSDIQVKVENDLLEAQNVNDESFLNSSLNEKITYLTNSEEQEQFCSYEQMLKKKRRKNLEQQNSHLTEIFTKVKPEDKASIRHLVKFIFQQQNSKQSNIIANINFQSEQWQNTRKKLVNVLPYSYFFVQAIYEEVSDMSSIYCKLSEQVFLLLLQLFIQIIKQLKLFDSGSASAIAIEFLYRIIHISMRIMWKKNNNTRNQPIELLCHHLGAKCPQLQSQGVFAKIYLYLEKKKMGKKSNTNNMESPRGMMMSFMKNMQEAMSIKKQAKLSQQQQYSCLIQVTYMMANLCISNQIAVPAVKKLLGKGENTKSFQYLKSILFEKKDQQERQKIFYRTQVKGKIESEMKKVIQNKKIVEYCIKITARRGFFTKQGIKLRRVCKQLSNIHQQILYRLDMPTQIKWIHLIPFEKTIIYQTTKNDVMKAKLAPSIEEIIVLDVNRSLHNHTETLSQQLLRYLLRAYAYYHPEIGYCQGMNYIAGYLYIKSKDEEVAFRMFNYLMEKRFKELFANQFEVLKLKLYQFQRLLGIFHPEISDHFKRQGITPECYIVSWIITIFASSYQYTQQSYFIDLLWQRFIIWGWRQFYRFVLAMFSLHKEQIIQLTYDKAMHFLGAIAKSDLITANKQQYALKFGDNHLKDLVQQYHISEQLLLTLEKEYKLK